MSKSSKRWLARQRSDPYVKAAKAAGHRSRAVYKLAALQEKYRIFSPGKTLVDLGAAPGGWSQWAANCVGSQGSVFAVDLLPMKSIEGVHFIQGDFTHTATYDQLIALLGEQKVDVVMSDMAPEMTGIRMSDQAKSIHLLELARDFAVDFLSDKGVFIAKAFHGVGFDPYLSSLRQIAKKVVIYKPDASRAQSREVYLVAWF